MSGGWNNGPVRDPWERIQDFCDFMRECFIAALILLAIGAVVDWLWIAG